MPSVNLLSCNFLLTNSAMLISESRDSTTGIETGDDNNNKKDEDDQDDQEEADEACDAWEDDVEWI